MSTRDPGGAPGELNPLIAQVPRAGEVPSHPSAGAATPGLALAGVHVPGGPSLPELDPMSLTRVVSQLANELFAAPPAPMGAPAPTDAGALTSPPSAPAAPVVAAPASGTV